MARKKRSDGAPSLRSPELESAIRAAPEDVDRYLVYADWLERHGDPRGGWIARHVDLMRDPSSTERLATLEAWLAEHRSACLPNIGGEGGSGTFRWRHGLLRAARVLRLSKSPSLAERTSRLFQHPSAAFLEGLILGFPVYKDADAGLDEVVRELANAPPTLSHLYLAETPRSLPIGELSPVFQFLPRLRRLVVNGEGDLGEVRAPELEELELLGQTLTPSLAAGLAVAELRGLRALHLSLRGLTAPYARADATSCALLAGILNNPTLDSLEVVSLAFQFSRVDEPVLDAVVGSRAFARLRRLELRDATVAAVLGLFASGAADHLLEVRIGDSEWDDRRFDALSPKLKRLELSRHSPGRWPDPLDVLLARDLVAVALS
jgi:uncharacterized protein (TIGR02996 family)